MYIPPSSTIKILRNVPLESNYQHTLYWSNLNSQVTYFNSMAKYTLDNQSYQRHGRNKMRVEIPVENLFDCNYLMFLNPALTSTGTGKWFFAFLTHVEYINNNTSEITYQIDVMQTWFFEHNFSGRRVFVEREHSITDVAGDNLIPENLELGEYEYTQAVWETNPFTQFVYLIPANFDLTIQEGEVIATDSQGGMYGGVYSPLSFHTFNEIDAVKQFIYFATTLNKSEGILGVYIVPSVLMPTLGSTVPRTAGLNFNKPTALGNYTPRNKKLLTSPYTLIYASDASGSFANFGFEYFSTNSCVIDCSMGLSGSPEIIAFPRNYKGVDKNYDQNIITQNCPQLPFIVDSYLAWSALKSNTFGQIIGVGNGITQGISGLISLFSGITPEANAISGLTKAMLKNGAQVVNNNSEDYNFGSIGSGAMQLWNGAKDIMQVIATTKDAKSAPDQMRGNPSSSALYANNGMGFRFYNAHIRPEFAQIIDEYFDMYGYATNRVKVPNRSLRPHWNFVKTRNCTINGTLPADDEKAICDIYDNGITFWNNPTEVGNYSLNNAPTT